MITTKRFMGAVIGAGALSLLVLPLSVAHAQLMPSLDYSYPTGDQLPQYSGDSDDSDLWPSTSLPSSLYIAPTFYSTLYDDSMWNDSVHLDQVFDSYEPLGTVNNPYYIEPLNPMDGPVLDQIHSPTDPIGTMTNPLYFTQSY